MHPEKQKACNNLMLQAFFVFGAEERITFLALTI